MGRILLGLLAAGTAVLAQSSLTDLVMPEARALFGANIERLRETNLAEGLWLLIAAQEPELVRRIKAAGLDPLRDVREVVLASRAGIRGQDALLVARGAFEQLKAAGEDEKDGVQREVIEDAQILTWEDRKQPVALALVGEQLLMLGDAASVRAALARRERPAPAGEELRRKALELAAQYEAWGVSTVPVAEMLARAPKSELSGLLKGDVVDAIEQISGGVRVGEELELTLTSVSRTEQDAARLANALRFFAVMAQSYRTRTQPLVKDLSVDGRTMRLSFAVSEDELERLARALGFGRKPPSAAAITTEGGTAPAAADGAPSGKTMVRQSP